MVKAAFPGSFDPPTWGHMNIIQRSASIFDEITVIVAENRHKKYLFSSQERLELIAGLIKPWKNVSVTLCTGLIVDFLAEKKIPVLIRGIRGGGDFSYEFELSLMNRALNPGIETVFFTTDPQYFVIRSSAIKELASFGGDVTAMVPEPVIRALGEKFNPG
ncbi:MAG: pantetheine-phosphate adenylyltransferase [Spirochaetaceae bacterium]|jgi:pantetheine-phosphate adenylyltransferase|nr:pantetheine-phosphate adenylyltransferase [Spirochaetaceae bacterium]